MLCLVHGYGLTGSGSNQWSRSIAEGMVENGETLHLVCQENRPDRFDFVSEAISYDETARPRHLFKRTVSYDGACIVHRPTLDVLPTYVRPQATNTYMAAILDLSIDAIDDYLSRNEAVMRHVLRHNRISAVQVNHVVLMAEAVRRACTDLGVPYGVLPHGSAIEYVVKRDAAMGHLAAQALSEAHAIFVLSDELRQRIQQVFPQVRDAADKMLPASAGVDTRRFRIVERADRKASIARLGEALESVDSGKPRAHRESLRAGLRDDLSLNDLLDLIAATEDYPPKLPDEGVVDALEGVDWQHDEIVTFVGKIIGYKGLPSLVAAVPSIAEKNQRVRLVIAGRGNLRGGLEAMVYALGDGKRRLVEKIVEWGGAVEGERPAPFERVSHYYAYLRQRGELEAYFDAAERLLSPERVIFTGYMEHDLLRHLFPCCDVAIFPSVVKEAAPLVVPEAMASGCFPMGTDYAGMAASLDVAATAVPEKVGRLMRLRHDARYTTRDIAEKVPAALGCADQFRGRWREVAVSRYDWRSIAADLAEHMRAMRGVGAA